MQKATRFSDGTNTSSVLLRDAILALEVEEGIFFDGLSPQDYLPPDDDGWMFFEMAILAGNVDPCPYDVDGWGDIDDFDLPSDFPMYDWRHIPPTEDSWVGVTSGEPPTSRGVEYLRWMMEGVKASEIASKDAMWVSGKYILFVASIMGRIFSEEIFDDPSLIIGRYSVELENRLHFFDIEHKVFGGITDAGYQRLKEITT